MKINEPVYIPTVHTCCRCGIEFRGIDRERVCASCRRPSNPPKPRAQAGQKLSRRENQISALVAQGLPNKEIAAQLYLSEGTIKVYLCHVYQKLGIGNRTELAVYTVHRGLAQRTGIIA